MTSTSSPMSATRGAPDEDALQRLLFALELNVGFEARDLAPVGVAGDFDVEQAEVGAVEKDHAGARPEERPLELRHGLLEIAHAHQALNGGGLPAGNDQSIKPVELVRAAYLDHIGAEPPQHRRVLAKVALDRQDADARCLAHPRETLPPGPSAPRPRFEPTW